MLSPAQLRNPGGLAACHGYRFCLKRQETGSPARALPHCCTSNCIIQQCRRYPGLPPNSGYTLRRYETAFNQANQFSLYTSLKTMPLAASCIPVESHLAGRLNKTKNVGKVLEIPCVWKAGARFSFASADYVGVLWAVNSWTMRIKAQCHIQKLHSSNTQQLAESREDRNSSLHHGCWSLSFNAITKGGDSGSAVSYANATSNCTIRDRMAVGSCPPSAMSASINDTIIHYRCGRQCS